MEISKMQKSKPVKNREADKYRFFTLNKSQMDQKFVSMGNGLR